MFRVVLRLGSFRVVNGWVGFRVLRFFALRVRVRVRVSFFFIPGFFSGNNYL